MNAMMCDRCGKFYPITKCSDRIHIERVHEYGFKTIDLCPNCEWDLEEWLKQGRKEENE